MVRTAGNGQALCSPEVSAILMKRVYAFAAQSNPDSSTDSLTARENEILELLDQGLTNQQIANRLSVTLHTVKNHVHSVLEETGCRFAFRGSDGLPHRQIHQLSFRTAWSTRVTPGAQNGLLTSVQWLSPLRR